MSDDDARTPETREPRRPSRRAVVVAVLVLLGLVIGHEIWWFATAEPAPRVDHARRLQALVERYQPEGEDGWTRFVGAAALVPGLDEAVADRRTEPETVESRTYLDYRGHLKGPVDAPDEIAGELLGIEILREQGAFDLLARAAACPRTVRPLSAPSPLYSQLSFPELSNFRKLSSIRVLMMRLAAARGDQAERVAAFEEALALARACGSQCFLIDRLVALAIIRLTLDELLHELSEAPIDEATGRALLAAMDRQIRLPPMSICYEAERAAMLDIVQYAYTDDGHGDGRLVLARHHEVTNFFGQYGPRGGALIERLAANFLAGRAEITDLTNEFYDNLVAEATMSPLARLDSPFDDGAFVRSLELRHIVLRTYLPAVAAAMARNDDAQMLIAGTRVMLGVETFRARHGRLPVSLDEVADECFPDGLPTDPCHGLPFVYRRIRSDDGTPTYRLYSTGVDSIDDIAAADEDVDAAVSVSGRVGDEGLDLMLNRTRPERDR
jgi:hypothetical protein